MPAEFDTISTFAGPNVASISSHFGRSLGTNSSSPGFDWNQDGSVSIGLIELIRRLRYTHDTVVLVDDDSGESVAFEGEKVEMSDIRDDEPREED